LGLAEDYDLSLFVLGDRYEICFAAVAFNVPFNIPVAHIGGGEKLRLVQLMEKFKAFYTCFHHFILLFKLGSNCKNVVSQIL